MINRDVAFRIVEIGKTGVVTQGRWRHSWHDDDDDDVDQ